MSAVIRPLEPAHWEAASAIYQQALEEGCSTFQTLCPSWEEWDRGHLPFCRLALEVDGRLAGWCALSPTSSRECYRGVAEVSILHGKGTGALKEEIRRYLRSVSEVASATDDHADRGGAGITVVRFRQ